MPTCNTNLGLLQNWNHPLLLSLEVSDPFGFNYHTHSQHSLRVNQLR